MEKLILKEILCEIKDVKTEVKNLENKFAESEEKINQRFESLENKFAESEEKINQRFEELEKDIAKQFHEVLNLVGKKQSHQFDFLNNKMEQQNKNLCHGIDLFKEAVEN